MHFSASAIIYPGSVLTNILVECAHLQATLKMKVMCYFERVTTYDITWVHILEGNEAAMKT
jgi:hypothetical protein